jgi:CTP:molybdopterin cytidylyltransferase MocA
MVRDGERINAVILAGALNEGKLKESSPERWEALIDLEGKPLIRHSVDPLIAAKTIDRIVVVGPVEEIRPVLAGLDIDIVPPTGDMFDNVIVGCRRLAETAGPKSRLTLVSAADIPLITAEVVDGLVAICLELGGDAFYPVASRETMEAKFPGTKRTYATLREGTLTGGNLFVVDGEVLAQVAPQAKALIAGRKNPLKMAGSLGIGFIFRLLLGRLTISALETFVGGKFGFKARAVIVPWAEIGIDVDKPEDLDLVKAYLQQRRSAG